MIAQITGTLTGHGEHFVVLDAHGVGYKLYATHDTISRAKATQGPITLFTHLIVREQALDLYGFTTQGDVSFFELLIGISGIGPKTALAILNLGDSRSLQAAVAAGDVSYLTRISGIGKKNAQKIVLELKDKLSDAGGDYQALDVTTLDALRSLGYTESEAKEALSAVPADIADEGERIKLALRHLGTR